MEYIDTHFHIWDLARFSYPWPTPDLVTLYHNVTLSEYAENISKTPVKYAIFVQVLNNNIEETRWVLEKTKHFKFLKGVVAGLDMTSEKMKDEIEELKQHREFVGVRHILDFEEEDWLNRQDVHQGLQVLQDANVTFDLLLRPHLLKYCRAIAEKYPKLRMVVDHIAKPFIKDRIIDGWKEDITALAVYPNVYCKISGLVTEADLEQWKIDDFMPYVEHIFKIFGEDRVMFGSDWPVCQLAQAQYSDVLNLAESLTASWSTTAKKKFFRDNAIQFYKLEL